MSDFCESMRMIGYRPTPIGAAASAGAEATGTAAQLDPGGEGGSRRHTSMLLLLRVLRLLCELQEGGTADLAFHNNQVKLCCTVTGSG